MDKKYDFAKLLEEYPETMNKDQLYRICHISKRTASYLLESGLIKNRNSGKKTRKYTIQTKDVITYLEERITDPKKYMAPAGYYRSFVKSKCKRENIYSSLVLTEEDREKLKEFFGAKIQSMPEVLSIQNISSLTGYANTSVTNWCRKKYLKSFFIKKRYLVPRSYLLEFMVRDYFMRIRRKSDRHMKLIYEFMGIK